jgi:hypothetical protein
MKTIVKLAVLVAALLLLTGVASAQLMGSCSCYKVTCSDLDRPLVITHYVVLCFDFEDNEGEFSGLCNEEGGMSLFFGLIKQALAFNPDVTAYLNFHGSWPLNVVDGDVYCYGDRWKAWGHVTDEENCPASG